MTVYFFLDPASIKVVAAFTNESEAAQCACESGTVIDSKVFDHNNEYHLLMVGRKIELDKYTEECEWLINGN